MNETGIEFIEYEWDRHGLEWLWMVQAWNWATINE